MCVNNSFVLASFYGSKFLLKMSPVFKYIKYNLFSFSSHKGYFKVFFLFSLCSISLACLFSVPVIKSLFCPFIFLFRWLFTSQSNHSLIGSINVYLIPIICRHLARWCGNKGEERRNGNSFVSMLATLWSMTLMYLFLWGHHMEIDFTISILQMKIWIQRDLRICVENKVYKWQNYDFDSKNIWFCGLACLPTRETGK